MTNRSLRLIASLAAAATLIAACSSGDLEPQPAAATAAPVASAASTVAPVASAQITEVAATTTMLVETTAPTSDTEPTVTVPATERWSARYADVADAGDGVHEGHVGIARHLDGGDIDVFPVSVRVTLSGAWASCVIDPASWRAEIAPAEHPYFDAREWHLRPESTEIAADPDADTASLVVVHTLVSGDDTATLTLTARSMPGCGAAGEAVEGSAEAGGEPDSSQSAHAGDESASEGADGASAEDDAGESGQSDEPETPTTEPEPEVEAALEAVEVEFRRWDHQALIDLPLWSHCPPEDWGSIGDRLDGYDVTWANWDSAAVEIAGRWIAVGYLTDAQIDRWLPGSGITADDAIEKLHYSEAADSTLIWRGSVTLHLMDTPRRLPTLEAAMRSRGVYSENLVESLKVTNHGIDGSGAWPADVHVGKLLTSWVRWRYSWPPTTAEPVAWPLRSLFEARESTCAGEALIAMCASGETPPAMLEATHPIGRVLRSLACAE